MKRVSFQESRRDLQRKPSRGDASGAGSIPSFKGRAALVSVAVSRNLAITVDQEKMKMGRKFVVAGTECATGESRPLGDHCQTAQRRAALDPAPPVRPFPLPADAATAALNQASASYGQRKPVSLTVKRSRNCNSVSGRNQGGRGDADPLAGWLAALASPPRGWYPLPTRRWEEAESRLLSASWMSAFVQQGSEHVFQ